MFRSAARGAPRSAAKLHDGPDRRVGGIRAGGREFDVVDPPVEAIDDQMDPIAQFVAAKPPPQQPPA